MKQSEMQSRVGGLMVAILTMAHTVIGQPMITRHPTNQSVSLGADVTFQVTATSSTSLVYQWHLSAMAIPGRTNRSLALTNIQIANAGDYSVLVSNSSGSVTSKVAHLEVDPAFTKITSGSIVTEIGTGQAGAWADYDNDGFIDLLVTSAFNPIQNTPQKNLLFHNDRNGTFTKITNSVLVREARDWRGAGWADYNNDGAIDLFVASTSDTGFAGENELFRNNGDGTFTKLTVAEAGSIVSLASGGSEGPAWGDYDNDGFVDLFIARYKEDWLFHNNGDGTFVQTTNSLAPDTLDSYSAAWADYDNDGYLDLFVANNVNHSAAANSLFHSTRDGSFSKVGAGPISTDVDDSITCAWADYDNDGYLDLFVGNFSTSSALYHNDGNGSFTRMTTNTVGQLAETAGFFTFAWGDYDNDGFIDLFVSVPGNPGKNQLYHNEGNGTFSQVTSGSLVNDASTAPSIGCAWGDYDNDGFLDLFVARGGDAEPATNLLYRNNGNSNAWVKLKLIGTASNRSAIGAKVRVKSNSGGRQIWQLREVSAGSGFNPILLDPHFGLGGATNIDELRIEWPSGIVQSMTNVPTRQTLTVVEHQPFAPDPRLTPMRVERLANGTMELSIDVFGDTAFIGLRLLFEGSIDLLHWSRLGPRTNIVGGTVRFVDSASTNLSHRFYRVSAP